MERWMMRAILPLVIFHIAVPTWDTYSDLALVADLAGRGHGLSAVAVVVPVILGFIFTTVAFLYYEENKTWYTWIFLSTQIWPQYKAIRIIQMIWNKNPDWRKIKEKNKREIGSLEPFLESLPQCYILTSLLLLDIFDGKGSLNSHQDNRVLTSSLFYLTYSSSILSASSGLVKFYKSGPTQFLRPGGALSGYLTCRYLLTYISVLNNVVSKVLQLALLFVVFAVVTVVPATINQTNQTKPVSRLKGKSTMISPFYGFTLSFTVTLLPHILFAFSILLATLKKQVLSIISKFPQFILSPTFAIYTFGAINNGCCCGENKMSLSKLWTWLNMVLNCIIGVTTYFIMSGSSIVTHFEKDATLYLGMNVLTFGLLVCGLPVLLSTISTSLILHLDNCCPGRMCYSCCPLTKMIILDPANCQTQFVQEQGQVVPFDGIQVRDKEMVPDDTAQTDFAADLSK